MKKIFINFIEKLKLTVLGWLILVIFSLIVLFLIINGTNEVLVISVPIIFFEMIPRLYSYNATYENKINLEKVGKTFKEVKEDQLILFLCIIYLSAIVGYSSSTVNFDKLFRKTIDFIISSEGVISAIIFAISSIILIAISSKVSNKYYKDYYK